MRKRSAKLSRIAIAIGSTFLIACWLLDAPRLATRVRAQTQPSCAAGQTSIALISGNGTVGGMDSNVQASTDGGMTFQSAFIVPPLTGTGCCDYSTIGGTPQTQWISAAANALPGQFSTFFYQTTFELPAGFSNASITVQILADNNAGAALNGNFLGAQPNDPGEPPSEFQMISSFGPNATQTFFQAGTNVLRFTVNNYTAQTALDFRADICFTPPQAGCVDRTGPVVNCSVEEGQLWPPNHDLENVGLKATITDDCDCFRTGDHDGDDDDDHKSSTVSATSSKGKSSNVGVASGKHKDDGDDDDDDDDDGCTETVTGSHSVEVKVYSDEPDLDIPGSGNFSPDAKNIGLGTLRLREERSGNGDGRVYLIVVKATDASGKSGFCSKTVTVPHDQSKASKTSVENQANAAKTYFSTHNNTPPPNFVQVGTGPVVGPKQ